MSQWQVLRYNSVSRAPLGYHVHHAAGVSVHYSTAAAALTAPDGSRSFCLSRDKHTLQQLNGRLASYLQQVQCLAAANQRLERQIQEELDRKCPGELKELDGHLRSVSMLQDQIRDCLSAQAQVKLQMLNAELIVLDLKMRTEQEREQRCRVEEELQDLRLLKEELRVNQLPELQSLLNDQTQQLMELQQEHQQDTTVLLGQVSGGVAVEMQTAKSSDLIQQLDCLRQNSVTLLDKNQNEFNTQVSRLSSPYVTFDVSVESEVDQAELGELRRTAARLTEELTKQQMLITHLEAYSQEQTESFVLKLRVLQETVDSLSSDLDSVLQATAKQAADHQTLLDVKNQLEAEIQDYRRLLDGMTHQGVLFGPHIQFPPAATSACVTTSPSASRRNNTADTVSVQGVNLRKMEVQTVSRGHIHTVGQTPVVAPLSETVTTVQSVRVHSNHQNNSALAERTRQKSTTLNQQSNLMENRVHANDLQVSAIVDFQSLRASDSGVVVNASKTEIISSAFPNRGSAIQTEPETSTLKTTTDTNLQAEMTKTIPCAETDVKQEPHLETAPEPGEPTAAEVFTKETNNLTADSETEFKTANASPGIQDNNDNHESKTTSTEILMVEVEEVEVVHDNNKVETDSETVTVAADVSGFQESITVKVDSAESDKSLIWKPFDLSDKLSTSVIDSGVSLSSSDPEQLLGSREADVPTSPTKPDAPEMCVVETPDDLKIYRPNISDTCMSPVEAKTLMDDNNLESVSLDQHSTLSTSTTEESNSEPNKVMDTPETGSNTANTSPGGLDSSDDYESKTASTEILKVEVEEVEEVHDNKKVEKDSETVTLSSADPEELLSLREADVPTKPATQEMCPNMSPVEVNTLTKNNNVDYTDAGSNTTNASSGGLDSSERKATSTETYKTETVSVSVVSEAKVHPSDEDNELDGRADQEASKLPISSPEDCLSPQEAGELMHPTKEVKCLSPEICMSPTETEVMLNMTDHVFCPVDPQENIERPDLLDEPKMVLSPSDPDTCLSPAEVTECPNGEEEDEEACLSLTEANAHVKPVEKYILSTKEEEGQSLSFSGEWKAAGSTDQCKDSRSIADDVKKNDSQVVNKPADSDRVFGKPASSRCSNGEAAFSSAAEKPEGIIGGNAQASTAGAQGRSRQGSGEWLAYGARVGRTGSSLPNTGSKESPKAMLPASSQPETGRFGSAGSGEWIVYGGSLKRKSSLDGGTNLSSKRKEDSSSSDSKLATSQSDNGRFKRRGSDEWMVYGSLGRKDNLARSDSLPNKESKDYQPTDRKRTTSPPATGRFGSEGSGEWRVYGGSSGRLSTAGSTEQVGGNRTRTFSPPGSYTSSGPRLCSAGSAERVSRNRSQTFSPPGSYTSSGPRLCSAGSGGKLSSGSVVRRSSSVGSGGRLSSSGSGGRLSSSPGSYRISSIGRYSSTGSGEWKPVYSSAGGRRSSIGSTGQHGGGRTTSSQRAPSPGGVMGGSGGSGGWLSSSAATGNRVSSGGSGNNLSSGGSNDRISNRVGGRISSSSGSGRTSSSSGSGRTSSTGGRVISSSDRPARSTGSGAGGNKERISVCKMAALSISAAGRERSQERQRQRSQRQQAAVTSPLVQRWLTTGVGVTSTDPEGLDDIMHL